MRHASTILFAVVVVVLSLASGAWAASDSFQVRYMSNLNIGDSVVNITNTGALNGDDPAGNICVNVYVYTPDESQAACCSCRATPNGLYSLSGRSDLISNTLTPAVPNSIVVKLVATRPVNNTCTNSAATAQFDNLAPGMRAWGTTLHAGPTAGAFQVTETEFSQAALSRSEFRELTSSCRGIVENGSGFGICRSCRLGGQ